MRRLLQRKKLGLWHGITLLHSNLIMLNIDDTANEHNNNFKLNNITNLYIKSLSKLMDGIFESFPKLFVDRILTNG